MWYGRKSMAVVRIQELMLVCISSMGWSRTLSITSPELVVVTMRRSATASIILKWEKIRTIEIFDINFYCLCLSIQKITFQILNIRVIIATMILIQCIQWFILPCLCILWISCYVRDSLILDCVLIWMICCVWDSLIGILAVMYSGIVHVNHIKEGALLHEELCPLHGCFASFASDWRKIGSAKMPWCCSGCPQACQDKAACKCIKKGNYFLT